MQVGINENIDYETVRYYEKYYDLLRTPDFNDKSRLLVPEHGIRIMGRPTNKKCRFCGRGENEASFKKIAHAFPEYIGNNVLASNYECDICNQYFGSTIENEYGNFFSLYHSIMKIRGKRGVPKCGFRVPCLKRSAQCGKHCIEIGFIEDSPFIIACREVSSEYISHANHSVIISKPVGKCCPIAVFKAFVKMAITVMPIEELSLFTDTIKWLLEPGHCNFYHDKKLLLRYEIIPGFGVTKYPHYCLFRRKKTVWNMPYMLFHLTYGCFSLFAEIPRDNDRSSNLLFERMPFPPIPFYTSESGTWDLSQREAQEGMKNSITLSYDTMENCLEDDKLKTLLQRKGFQFAK